MEEIIVNIVNNSLNDLPTYAHENDSGVDLRSSEDVILFSKKAILVSTDLYIAIPTGFEIQIRSRSGLAINKGLFVLNSPGTIDSGYRNQIGIIIYNTSNIDVKLEKGSKIAQAVLCPVYKIKWNLLKNKEDLTKTDRNINGFGSSGL